MYRMRLGACTGAEWQQAVPSAGMLHLAWIRDSQPDSSEEFSVVLRDDSGNDELLFTVPNHTQPVDAISYSQSSLEVTVPCEPPDAACGAVGMVLCGDVCVPPGPFFSLFAAGDHISVVIDLVEETRSILAISPDNTSLTVSSILSGSVSLSDADYQVMRAGVVIKPYAVPRTAQSEAIPVPRGGTLRYVAQSANALAHYHMSVKESMFCADQTIKISFQPSTVAAPAGYLVDSALPVSLLSFQSLERLERTDW